MFNVAFTIVSRNYFAYARTLGASLTASNPSISFHVLVVDRKDPAFAAKNADLRITWVEDLDIPNFEHVALKYDILELNTNVKPTFVQRLLQSYDKVIYLDPDIFVYSSLQPIYDLLDEHGVVLTPHITRPIDDDRLPSEQEFMTSGIYNLGFAAFNSSPEAAELLAWWERRCLNLAYNEQAQGLFVDQKWMDFAPSLCPTTAILREPQYNMAYWNMHERQISWSDGVPYANGRALVFFHFSGLPPEGDDRVSKYQTRYSLGQRPDLAPLFEEYRKRLTNNGHSEYLKLPYGFATFSDGTPLNNVARRVAASSPTFDQAASPFNVEGSLFKTLKASRLLPAGKSGALPTRPLTARAADIESARLERITVVALRMLIRIFGPLRYERLMRYATRMANLRRQTFLLKKNP
jgi:lipopolysaccharide biosynthesis glycosyltransferase